MTLYFGSKQGARFIGYWFGTGWKSSKHWRKGFMYYEPTVCTGQLYMNTGKIYKLPEILVPNQLYNLWMLRKPWFRKQWREERAYQKINKTR